MTALNSILVATDFSRRADRAIGRAAILARQSGARLVLAHVVDDDQPDPLVAAERQAAETALNEMIAVRPELLGLACEAEVVLGDPFDGIVRAARQTAAGLIVIGAHRRQILRDIFIGTTVERVIRSSETPVLMVNAEPAGPYSEVLAAMDLSDCAGRALVSAKSLGLLERVRLSVLHAVDTPAKNAMIHANVDRQEVDRHLTDVMQRARRDLVAFLASLGLEGLDGAILLREGAAAGAIAQAVEDVRPDLVIIGTHGRSGLGRLLLGSVAAEILARLRCDVLAVPPAE